IVNPSGVIVTESGSINANKFGISTSPIDTDTLNAFKEANKANNGVGVLAPFSPVFKSNSTRGDIINKGSIQANEVVMVGNRVILEKAFNDKGEFNQINTNNISIEGKDISIDVASINGNTLNSLSAKASNKAKAYLDATGYYYNTSSWNVFDKTSGNNLTKDKYVGIGSDRDWWHFAKGTNEKEDFRNTAKEYRLTSDIDFGAKQGKNYANYCIEGLGCTSMIVGDSYAFSSFFNGNGYTLKNINIDTTNLVNKPQYVGIFGKASNANFGNIIVNYGTGGIEADFQSRKEFGVGGFVGSARDSDFNNISLALEGIRISSIEDFKIGGFAGEIDGGKYNSIEVSIKDVIGNGEAWGYSGGFAGEIDGGKFENIKLSNMNNIIAVSGSNAQTGGFAGMIREGEFSQISLGDIIKIEASSNALFVSVGGFAGKFTGGGIKFTNISLGNIQEILGYSKKEQVHAGGFVGDASGEITFENISIAGLNKISATTEGDNSRNTAVGGFLGYIFDGEDKIDFKKIYLFFEEGTTMSVSNDSKEMGKFYGGKIGGGKLAFEDIYIYHKQGELTNATENEGIVTPYTDRDNAYKDFTGKIKDIQKPIISNITPPNKEPEVPESGLDENGLTKITLNENDFSKELVEQIINEIYSMNFVIDLQKHFDKEGNYIYPESLKQTLSFLRAFNGEDGALQELLHDKDFANSQKDIVHIDKMAYDFVEGMKKIEERVKFLKECEELIKEYNEVLKEEQKMSIAKKIEEKLAKMKQYQQDLLAIVNHGENKQYDIYKANGDNVGGYVKFTNPFNLVWEEDNRNDNQTINAPTASIVFRNQIKEVFVKPAEEVAIDEEEGRLNRKTCYVSDNFKTNNPCMAQRI
ncbi:hypothetical protein B6S12_00005, partial [Helicobacter valdiviensis]